MLRRTQRITKMATGIEGYEIEGCESDDKFFCPDPARSATSRQRTDIPRIAVVKVVTIRSPNCLPSADSTGRVNVGNGGRAMAADGRGKGASRRL